MSRSPINALSSPLGSYHVLRALDLIVQLGKAQDVFRYSGRGARYVLRSSLNEPTELPARDVTQAVEEYFARVSVAEMDAPFMALMGTVSARAAEDRDLTSIFGVRQVLEQEWRVVTDPSGGGESEGAAVLTAYWPSMTSYAPLASLLGADPELAQFIPSDVVTAVALLAAITPYALASASNLASAAGLGILHGPSETMRSALAEGLGEARDVLERLGFPTAVAASVDELVAAAEGVPSRLWPVKRGMFIRTGAKIVVDLYGATNTLDLVLRAANIRGGRLANIRLADFETEVQHVVDSSRWRPAVPLAALRGRTLRRKGQALTDVDAIGACGDRLLLVSCKGRVHTSEIEIGDYAATRNAGTFAEEATSEWAEVIRNLRAEPKGDNFDFSAYAKIAGVVCIPFPMFLLNAKVRNRSAAPGLRFLSSLAELSVWLNTEGN